MVPPRDPDDDYEDEDEENEGEYGYAPHSCYIFGGG
jgi:hypothetical protein